MNENQNYNGGNVTPYRASGNLNTMIANPSINVNDTMNVNIQNMATNSGTMSNNQSYGVSNSPLYNNPGQVITDNKSVENNFVNNVNNNQMVNNQSSSYVNKTYVTNENRPKKKTIKFNLGPEFRIALLIVVVLLVFVFLLPLISKMLGGY